MKLKTIAISLAWLATVTSQASAVVISTASIDWTKLSITYVGDTASLIVPVTDQSIQQLAQVQARGLANIDKTDKNQSDISTPGGQASATIRSTLDVANPSATSQNASTQVSTTGLQMSASTRFEKGGDVLGSSGFFEETDGILLDPGMAIDISLPYHISCRIDDIVAGFKSYCFTQVVLDARITDATIVGPNEIDGAFLFEEFRISDPDSKEKSGIAHFTLTNSSHNSNFLRFSLNANTSASISAVPIPSALPLLVTGVGALAAARRRKRK